MPLWGEPLETSCHQMFRYSQPGGRACSDLSLSPSLKEMSNGTGHFYFYYETKHGRRAGAERFLDSFGGGG